jgi:predicted DNA-binding protein (UPF0251 family)
MSEMTLTEYVALHGQTKTAEQMGLTQGAVWQMLQRGRDVRVVAHPDGAVEFYERKPVGRVA